MDGSAHSHVLYISSCLWSNHGVLALSLVALLPRRWVLSSLLAVRFITQLDVKQQQPKHLQHHHYLSKAMKLLAPLCSALVLLFAGSNFGAAQDSPSPAAGNSSAEQAVSSSEQLFGSPISACPRIRRSWDIMSTQEKALYLRAIELSMDNGLYIKFVEIHTEQMTTAEAHGTCMFIFWHRAFLLGFENMLRSLGSEFACVTIPFWNYVDHNALFLRGACSSMEDCSPILRDLGGSRVGPTRTVDINGTPIQGTCVSAQPANHFCESSGLRGNQCARCIPRGDWASTPFPPTTSVSSLLRQLFTTQTIAAVATNIEQGIHSKLFASAYPKGS